MFREKDVQINLKEKKDLGQVLRHTPETKGKDVENKERKICKTDILTKIRMKSNARHTESAKAL